MHRTTYMASSAALAASLLFSPVMLASCSGGEAIEETAFDASSVAGEYRGHAASIAGADIRIGDALPEGDTLLTIEEDGSAVMLLNGRKVVCSWVPAADQPDAGASIVLSFPGTDADGATIAYDADVRIEDGIAYMDLSDGVSISLAADGAVKPFVAKSVSKLAGEMDSGELEELVGKIAEVSSRVGLPEGLSAQGNEYSLHDGESFLRYGWFDASIPEGFKPVSGYSGMFENSVYATLAFFVHASDGKGAESVAKAKAPSADKLSSFDAAGLSWHVVDSTGEDGVEVIDFYANVSDDAYIRVTGVGLGEDEIKPVIGSIVLPPAEDILRFEYAWNAKGTE